MLGFSDERIEILKSVSRLRPRQAGPPNYLDDKVDSDQWVVDQEKGGRGTESALVKGVQTYVNRI